MVYRLPRYVYQKLERLGVCKPEIGCPIIILRGLNLFDLDLKNEEFHKNMYRVSAVPRRYTVSFRFWHGGILGSSYTPLQSM